MNGDDKQLELLTAYLDGELTAEERVECETLLAGSEPHRRLLGELEAVSERVQTLPKLELGDRFTERVVSAARAAEENADRDTEALPLVQPESSPNVHGKWQRSWGWIASSVVAAAVLLIVARSMLSDNRLGVADSDSGDPSSSPRVADVETLPETHDAQPTTPQDSAVAPPATLLADSPTDSPEASGADAAGTVDAGSSSPDAFPASSHQLVWDRPADAAPLRLMLVIDVRLTDEGIKSRVFDRTLRQAGIQFGPTIRLDEQLERELLASRLKPLQVKDEEKAVEEQRPKYAELVYVKARGGDLDRAILNLIDGGPEVAAVSFDVARATDVNLFQQLDRAAGNLMLADNRRLRNVAEGEADPEATRNRIREQTDASNSRPNTFVSQAQRVALSSVLRLRLAQPFQIAALPASMLGAMTHQGAPPKQPEEPLLVPRDVRPQPDEKLQEMRNTPFQVLFVVRKNS